MFESYFSFPDINPVAFRLGFLEVRWYALAYVMGVLFTWQYVRFLVGRFPTYGIIPKHIDDLVSWGILGIILGGRLGYVLFYDPSYFWEKPLHIFMTWKGGMAFHGGLLGVMLAFWLFTRLKKIPFLRLLDLIALGAPMGLFLGRLANFINGELYGRITDVPWAVMFPLGGYLPRHPSQLYEAFLEGLLILGVLNVCFWGTRVPETPGRLTGLGLMLYAAARFSVEYVREPDAHIGLLWNIISMGQLLSIPYFLLGGVLFWRKGKK